MYNDVGFAEGSSALISVKLNPTGATHTILLAHQPECFIICPSYPDKSNSQGSDSTVAWKADEYQRDEHVIRQIANRVLIFAFVLAAPLTAPGESLNVVLTRDLVEVRKSQYFHTQINRCLVTMAGSSEDLSRVVTVSREIEAPETLLSRDQFVSISTQLMVRNRIALASILQPGIDPIDARTAIECRRAVEPVDAIDFRIVVRMATAGVTMETTNVTTGKQATDQFEWHEILNLETD